MLKIFIYKNIQMSNFYDMVQAWGEGVGIGYQNEEILKFVPSRLLKLLT